MLREPEENLFRFDHVAVSHNGVAVLTDVSADVPAQGFTIIVGPSGSGKTTLLRLCNRLSVPTSGNLLFRGVPVSELDPLALRRRVGMVFQKPVLFGGTVADNLRAAHPGATPADMADVLTRVGLPVEFLDRTADDLSGGEAQRVCLARTLLTRPEVLLMDEPTASVDQALRLGLEREARTLADQGVAVLWVTHDLTQMRRLAGHVIALEAGKVRFQGSLEGFESLDRDPSDEQQDAN